MVWGWSLVIRLSKGALATDNRSSQHGGLWLLHGKVSSTCRVMVAAV